MALDQGFPSSRRCVSKPKTLLSLFDGTGSICRPFVAAGWTVRRLDMDGRHGADIVTDVRQWDPSRDWRGPAPDVVFAGPPCENYSLARTRACTPRDLRLADSLVTKTLEIIEHFHGQNPRMLYFVENPDSSMLWRRWVSHRLYEDPGKHFLSSFVEYMDAKRGAKSYKYLTWVKRKSFTSGCRDSRIVRLDYCMYGTKYRKRTRLMTNSPFEASLCKKNCSGFRERKHAEAAQRGPYDRGAKGEGHSLDELHAYPARLADAIFTHVSRAEWRVRQGLSPSTAEPVLRPVKRQKNV
uniref:DNA methyltransferase-like n=1 Tax=Oryzias latipes TaxID=8090 RepID=A0A286P9W8_ORYLA|nr:DNA methyltransferase-like [Oryzias latipes]